MVPFQNIKLFWQYAKYNLAWLDGGASEAHTMVISYELVCINYKIIHSTSKFPSHYQANTPTKNLEACVMRHLFPGRLKMVVGQGVWRRLAFARGD